jgi:hypothetical protein
VFAIANFGQIKRRIDVLLVSKGQFMSVLLCVVLSFLFCLLPNFLFHKNLMRAHIVTLVLDAEKVLTILFTNESSRYCVHIFRVSDNLLKVNKPTLPLASGEFSVPTTVLLIVAFLVMVMLYVSHRDLRTIYSGIPHGLIFFSHCSFFSPIY